MQVAPGSLLAAWPDLQDPNFMHSVVLMCQHSEEGAYGLVVNRPIDVPIRKLLPEHPLLGTSDFPVHLGGPVDHETLQFLHALPDDIPGGFPLTDTLYLGGDLDGLGRVLAHGSDRERSRVRLVLGYSGWGPQQLEIELAAGSWIPAPASLEAVFDDDTETTWRRVVRSIGPGGPALERQPPDVTWN